MKIVLVRGSEKRGRIIDKVGVFEVGMEIEICLYGVVEV